MTVTRVFKSGNSTAVRIPKEFAFKPGEVYIEKRGDEIVIREKPKTYGELMKEMGWKPFPDFMKGWKRDKSTDKRRQKLIDDFSSGH